MVLVKSSAVVLLLALQWAAGSWACLTPEGRCDFVCDCTDCSDELDCGYGKGFECDFEDAGMCGWTPQSSSSPYSWERLQGDALADSGPNSDYTTGTAMGWFMGVKAVNEDFLHTAVLISPEMKQSSPTCRLRLRYFLWDSDQTGLGSSPLWASVIHQGSQEAIVWRPEASSVRGWREASIFLGRIPSAFQVRLHSQRSKGQRGDVAIDQLEFLNCALPLPLPGKECPAGMVECKSEACVAQSQVCDGTDDCGDGTDEENCDGYRRCNFEDGLCDWDLRSLSKLKWVRTNQKSISTTDPLKGPGRDHSNNSASGYFLYVTVPETGLTNDWAAFQSPSLQPTNSSHPCKMVMYTHQFGPRSGGLTVLVSDRTVNPVWKRGGSLGDLWVKAEVEIVADETFQILIMAAIRNFSYGGIGVDSISLSPECRLSSENNTLEKFPNPPNDPCTEPDKMCDFHEDCEGAADEAKCGDFSYPEGSSGWTDISTGSQGWVLHKNSTAKEEYLYVVKTPGQQLTEAQTQTPLLGPTGPACNLSFDFALTGNPNHIGELSVRVIDSLLGMRPKLWEFSGKTGKEEDSWQSASVFIGVRKYRFQLVFEARAAKLCPCAKIKVKNVRFTSCHADSIPSLPTALSCNFEDGLCGWYQDNSDNFDWTVQDGMDHTIGIGRSLVVDMWSPSLRGAFGRLISFPQSPGPTEYCLSFFYKLYGPNTGALNVKLFDKTSYETVLWTRSGAHGNMWHEAHCPVPHQLTDFQLMFEAVRYGFDGRVAIDDVVFLDGPCPIQRMCSFEAQQCGYSSSGDIRWLHRNGHTTTTGPKADHTLGTELGFYMMVNTAAAILPSGGTTVLSSPVRYGTTKTECVHFWYHMGGVNPGFLTVYMKPAKGDRVKIFSDSLNQGDVWRHGNGNISSGLLDWQLEFEVIGAGGESTHVAVDDIFISPHPCEDRGSKCTLETGMCSWSNTQNSKVDKLDWELTSQEAEQHYSTPPEDHTLGNERGHFLFFSSSNRTAANQNAQLFSPHLPPTKGTCLKFWAYIPSSSDCLLNVWRLSEGHLHQLLVVDKIRGPWLRFDVNIESAEEYQIVFEGIKGTSGVVALDDIEYTIGFDCSNKHTDSLTTSSSVDNVGGIAASVIVALLLMATLIALLIYYLRTKQGTVSSPTSAAGGFTNEVYEGGVSEDHVKIPQIQNHPMAAGFNEVSVSSDVRDREV
ncbi:apical endosomal glycoprotein [Mugil cephalus]|uniref:apical endosomal glycoprotein n=1 Tax=Mugil cephalus TaxID=48193 RepID=UPI001FB6B71D|nr:apical endosomal glycoprotein [Mugil cephalus]